MQRQQKISAAQLLRKKVGKSPAGQNHEASGGVLGQRDGTKYDAPEIDGNVHIMSRRPLRAGEIVTVKVERADAYDLYGTAV